MTPSNLSANIASRVPHFRTLPEVEQWAITRMAWIWKTGVDHSERPGCCAFTKQFLRTLWKSDERARTCLGHRYFSVFPGLQGRGIAHAWRPKAALMAALQACCDDPEPCDLLDDNGNSISRLPTALPARRGSSKSSYTGLKCANTVEVNICALTRCAATGLKEHDRKCAAALLRIANNRQFPGRVPIRYEEKDTGRLFARGGVLQGYSRAARKAALCGAWDYDISNCHFSVMRHFAGQLGIAMPTVDAYLTTKRETRQRLSESCGADIDAVKQALIALVYGMPLSPWSRGSLTHTLGGPEAARRFKQDKFVRALLGEVKLLMGPLIDHHTRSGGRVVNALGRAATMQRGPWRLLAHILQGVEAAALRAILSGHGDNVLLAVHDGWICRSYVDPRHLESLIERETGCRLTVECAILQTSLPSPETADISVSNQELTEIDIENDASTKEKIKHQDPAGRTDPSNPSPDAFFVHDPSLPASGGLTLSGCVFWSVQEGVKGVPWSTGKRRKKTVPAGCSGLTPPVV